jgi:hypothetical protein
MINWSEIPKSKTAELKELLGEVVTLLEKHDQVVELLGLETLSTIDYTSARFSIFVARHSDLIQLGERLEQEYQNKLQRFTP